MKIRMTTITATLVVALLAACGVDYPGGSQDPGADSGTGDNTATTADSGYN